MKKYIKALRTRINRLGKKTKYFLVFSLGIFVAFSILVALAFSDWFFNHRTSQTEATRIETPIVQSQYEKINAVPVTQEATQARPRQTTQPTKSTDTTSAEDQAKIDELKAQQKQVDAYNKQMEQGFDDLKNTLENQKITAPEIKPITVPDVDIKKIETPELPQPHTKQVCWDDSVFGKQCKTTVEFY
jgi:cytoskeletal protein RodZ